MREVAGAKMIDYVLKMYLCTAEKTHNTHLGRLHASFINLNELFDSGYDGSSTIMPTVINQTFPSSLLAKHDKN